MAIADDPAPDAGWTALEQWVWCELLAGREADLDRHDGGTARDPCDPAAWDSDDRVVRPATIIAILTSKP